jgi:hypothetical protein
MDLTVKLGLFLSPMKAQIEDRLTRKIDETLARYQAQDAAAEPRQDH